MKQNNKLPTIKINWAATWARYKQEHGPNPIVYRGRLLFEDGYRHAINDPKGPEWPPKDENEKRELQIIYWSHYQSIITATLQQLQSRLEVLKSFNSIRSSPIQHTVSSLDNKGQTITYAEDFDPINNPIHARIEQLKYELDLCNSKLEKLNSNKE
jgi:hypothetical protein